MPSVQGLSEAADLVRRPDRERFVTALFAPLERREALMVLYAFNTEVARVREMVKEPMAGLVRLQWWREVVSGSRSADRHPVAAPLTELIRAYELPLEPFERLLTARESDLYAEPPADLAAAEAYADDTSGGLTALAVRLLGGGEAAAVAGHSVGIAWSLIGQLRALPFALSMGRLTLPVEVVRTAGTTPEEVLAGGAPRPVLAAAAARMGARAAEHLAMARRHRLGRTTLAALLPATIASRHLRMLAIARWDVFDPRVAIPRANPLRLWLSHAIGRF
ncbi:MAG: squalene/phytoene synthase family protein [Magnetospirillum sp.]|nr:squalene/phytoene synthase family protein [Magnetospirillum sp.]